MSDKYKDVTNKLCEIEDYITELKNNIQSMIQYVQDQQAELVNSNNEENNNGKRESSDD